MTYDASERSHQAGSPVELYTFTRNAIVIGRYTSAEVTQSVGGHDYLPWPGGIRRNEIGLTGDDGRNVLKLTVAADFPVARLVHLRPRTGVIGLVVQRFHRPDDSALVTIWAGRVSGALRDRSGARVLQCEPRTSTLNRNGLRRVCGKNCQHELYGPKCRLVQSEWGHATTISTVSGTAVTVATVGSGLPYTGGIVERTDGGGITDVAYIKSATGTALVLDLALYGAQAGDAVTLYPGCDWTMATCDGVFDNAPNYGGRLHLPDRNPVVTSAFS